MKKLNIQRKDYISWDEYFMGISLLSAKRSKAPNTQVGACIVKNNKILSIGYNGTPIGFKDEYFPWSREGLALETKYLYVCHAEMNAIANFEGNRSALDGAKLYVTLFPCNECAKLIVQNGIKEIIYLSDKYKDTDGIKASKKLFDACKVAYKEFSFKDKNKIELHFSD